MVGSDGKMCPQIADFHEAFGHGRIELFAPRCHPERSAADSRGLWTGSLAGM